jgi:hypothetical protein
MACRAIGATGDESRPIPARAPESLLPGRTIWAKNATNLGALPSSIVRRHVME